MAPTDEEARARAEATVRAYCGWHIAPEQDDDITLDGPGSGALLLPSLRVVAVTSVTEDGVVLDPSAYSWSATGLLRRCPAGWVVWQQPRWTDSLRGVQVAFTHGYTEWPAEVLAVLDRLVARAGAGLSTLTQVGAVQYAMGSDGLPAADTLSSADAAVLAPYRLPFRP